MHLVRHGKRLPPLRYYGSAWHIWFRVVQIRTLPAMENALSSSILRVGTTELVSGLQDMHLVCHGKRLHPLPYYGLVGHLLSLFSSSQDVLLTFETVGLQFCYKSRALRNGNTPDQFPLIVKHIREKMTLCNFSHFSKLTCVLVDILYPYNNACAFLDILSMYQI